MNRLKPINTFVPVLLIVVFGFAIGASAAEVRSGLSERETYVGLPVTMQVKISDASDFDPPEPPRVEGLSIQPAGPPSRSTQISIANGRRSETSSTTYSFRVTPREVGTFQIPPFQIKADGRTHQTQSMTLVASKSETGDLLLVEIEGKQESIYVGQALELTLKIWVRPYRDQQRNVVLSEGDMWNLIAEETNWGPFSERIASLRDQNQRPGGKEVLRQDNNGDDRSYYLYEIDATIYPQRPGEIDGDDVQVVLRYPTALGKSRDPFGSLFGSDSLFGSSLLDDDFFGSPFGNRLSIQSVRPVVAQTAVEPIRVRPIPEKGRPVDYRGAVGRYQIATEAKPTKVAAGDPITLHIGIAGTGPMNRIQAPPIAQLPSLTSKFKVPDEPLAGFVDGPQKVFTTTIRAKEPGIDEIPAIPFSFFDPETEKFVTVHSEPIAIEVEQAETLSLDSIAKHNADSRQEMGPSEDPSG
ncbi:MAG: BatD protein, partial [Pirellulaceae bacterium]|nr:BatD protein [Pirellulaceae bacterium]